MARFFLNSHLKPQYCNNILFDQNYHKSDKTKRKQAMSRRAYLQLYYTISFKIIQFLYHMLLQHLYNNNIVPTSPLYGIIPKTFDLLGVLPKR